MNNLTLIVAIPFLAALFLAFIPRREKDLVQPVAMMATLVTMVLAIILFVRFDAGAEGYQFVFKAPFAAAVGIFFHFGVDGINLGLILMGSIVGFAATCVSFGEIKEREKEFYILLLVMIGGILGSFASVDIFMFFFFHEFALVPTFIMIGVWGRGDRKNYATFKITIYLVVGSMIALFGLIALYLQAPEPRTFDMAELARIFRENPIGANEQNLIFPLLMFGFGILVSLWPFHTWAPLGYASAPTATAMMHAGVIKKFGLYGLIRIALPMCPTGAQNWLYVLAFLCLGNILYCGFVAMRQKDLNLLIGNSSVAHMGFAFLGIASLSLIGITGAVLVMVAHGLLAALTFGLSGYLYNRTGTLDMDKMGGYLHGLPFIGSALVMAMMAGCGLPGFANFAGEAMVFFGAWKPFPIITTLAVWGALVIGAVYMLRAIRKILHGPVNEETFFLIVDATDWRQRAPFALLLATLLLFGFAPRLLTSKIQPSAKAIVNMANGVDARIATAASLNSASDDDAK